MKKISVLLSFLLVVLLCVGCGPYGDYAGKYTEKGKNITITVTLSSSGDFEWRCVLSSTHPHKNGPYDNDNYNVRKGSFTVKDNVIKIEYSYYDEPSGQRRTGSATARLKNNKLVISGNGEIDGTYTKQ